MNGVCTRTLSWIEERTGVETAVRNFLFESIPASSGWPHVFGSVALFLFLMQVFTGVLLSFNYAPVPGDAYLSLSYIIRNVVAGKMIHGLHHWGASLMIIVVALHMAQVFIYGAYKKPREATWMAGVLLLLITLAFGLTGYLLPWDNRAYWGTMVTTRIAAQTPLFGEYLLRLIGAANGIGVLTLSRFYALHTIILPVTTILLITLHIYLVRRHGITPGVDDDLRPRRRFYPRQAFLDTVAIFVAFIVLFLAALVMDVRLERMADPTDTSYVPRPEWYFLFLFQSLKLFQGSLEPVGSIGLPTAAVIALFAIPFMDRARARKISQRTAAISIAIFLFACWGVLTGAAVASTPGSSSQQIGVAANIDLSEFSPEQIAGAGYFRAERCDTCHNIVTGEPKLGPNLLSAKIHHSKEWMIGHFNNPEALNTEDPERSTHHLSLPQLNALSVFVQRITAEDLGQLDGVPGKLVHGAEIYVSRGCGSCHRVNGAGGEIGPALNGLAHRRSKQWVESHFLSPQKLSPGSIMPPYRLSSSDEDALVSFLFSLPE